MSELRPTYAFVGDVEHRLKSAAALLSVSENTLRTTLTESGIAESATTTPARFWERAPAVAALPPEPSASAPSKSPTDAPTGLVADGLWASTNVPSASTDVPTGSVAELLAVTLAPGARLLLDRRRYPELDGRLEAALRNLSAALRAVARSPQDRPDGGEEW